MGYGRIKSFRELREMRDIIGRKKQVPPDELAQAQVLMDHFISTVYDIMSLTDCKMRDNLRRICSEGQMNSFFSSESIKDLAEEAYIIGKKTIDELLVEEAFVEYMREIIDKIDKNCKKSRKKLEKEMEEKNG